MPTQAADPDGQYAVRGAGAHACSHFAHSVENEPETIPIFVSWIDGHLSAHNRLTGDTFDATFIANTQEFAGLLYNLCRAQPDMRIETALVELLAALAPARVRSASDPVQIRHDETRIVLRGETMRLAQRRLEEKGLYDAGIDGQYGPAMASGLRRFQRQRGLPTTAVPDADTLLQLLLGDDED